MVNGLSQYIYYNINVQFEQLLTSILFDEYNINSICDADSSSITYHFRIACFKD